MGTSRSDTEKQVQGTFLILLLILVTPVTTVVSISILLLPVMGLGLTLVGGGVLGGCNEGGGVVTMVLPVRGGGYGNEDGITKFPLSW